MSTAKSLSNSRSRSREKFENLNRNLDIVYRYKNGDTVSSIARVHGLTRQSVQKILKKSLEDREVMRLAALRKKSVEDWEGLCN